MTPSTKEKKYQTGLIWFRRDLRADDNAALHHALKSCVRVYCVFIFDRDILDPLPRADRRVEFIRESLLDLSSQLAQLAQGSAAQLEGHYLAVQHEAAGTAIARLARQLSAEAVFANHDYEPYAITRDAAVQHSLEQQGAAFHTFKDHVVFERGEVLTLAGRPYTVFTPYKNAWLKKIDSFYLKPYPIASYAAALAPIPQACRAPIPDLQALGFERTNLQALKIPTGSAGGRALLQDFVTRMKDYGDTRNFPAVKGPSYLGVHLRFGTLSIRQLAGLAWDSQQSGSAGAAVWLNELIWRDFYAQILANFPHVNGHAFKPEYDRIEWASGKKADASFDAWCSGQTGYPLVDAAMAQINQTGYMHNRLRMVVASFLMKDLGLDWRRGEAYFAMHLNDFDLASNNGGWQWAASSGCDAQPYFRIFNPTSQSEKFDPEGRFIRRYLPVLAALPNHAIHAPSLASPLELAASGVQLGINYPHPIVSHAIAREQTLQRYAVVRSAVSQEPDSGVKPKSR